MYAIIEVGAKQFNVKKGDIIDVERLSFKASKDVTLDKVLLVSKDKKVEIGQPYIKGAKVLADLVGNVKGEKQICFKYRRRKSSHWTKGHRQQLSRLKIKEIDLGS